MCHGNCYVACKTCAHNPRRHATDLTLCTQDILLGRCRMLESVKKRIEVAVLELREEILTEVVEEMAAAEMRTMYGALVKRGVEVAVLEIREWILREFVEEVVAEELMQQLLGVMAETEESDYTLTPSETQPRAATHGMHEQAELDLLGQRAKFAKLFCKMDTDGDGYISQVDFIEALRTDHVVASELGLPHKIHQGASIRQ